MDEEVPAVEDSMNASYSGKVSIIASYYQDNRGTLKSISMNATTEFWEYRGKITKVVFEDTINPKDTDLFWDVSEEQNGSVMSYLVPNGGTEEAYTLYIQSNGGANANSDSSYLFYGFTQLVSIEGLEYFNTSDVTDMRYMFSNCSSITSLDVSSFNTGNVTNMMGMFYSSKSLTSLDVSSFNTSNVTNMGSMFSYCNKLTSLDVSSFNTSNVTIIEYMFYNCFSLSTLDLSSFNMGNVTYRNQMFGNMLSDAIIKVKDLETQTWILNFGVTERPMSWTTANVIVAS